MKAPTSNREHLIGSNMEKPLRGLIRHGVAPEPGAILLSAHVQPVLCDFSPFPVS